MGFGLGDGPLLHRNTLRGCLVDQTQSDFDVGGGRYYTHKTDCHGANERTYVVFPP